MIKPTSPAKKHKELHGNKDIGYSLKNIILGGQDGIVNVFGVIIAVATATLSTKIVLVAGLAATFAESISMAAVAYTSVKTVKEFYNSQLEKEKREVEEVPAIERKEIHDIYYKKGFRDSILAAIVKKVTGNKKLWVKTMMEEELHLYPDEYESPLKDASIVGIAAFVGSLIPLAPFFFFDVQTGIIMSVLCSAIILFITGFIKGKLTTGKPWKSALELTLIGMTAAIAGYLIGALLGVAVYAA